MKTMFVQKSGPTENYYSSLQSLIGKKHEIKDVRVVRSLSKPQGVIATEHVYEIINSQVKFSDVVQTPSLKEELDLLVEEYTHQETLRSYGMAIDNKLIFYGPSGCGKTLTALALANKLKKKLFVVNLSTVVDSSLGKTSSNISQLVDEAINQRGIVFFDEFDALAKMRTDANDHGEMKRVASSLIQKMDFLDPQTLFIAATNHIDLIDKAIIRRFNKKISFGLPTKKNLEAYITKLVAPIGLSMDKQVVGKLADQLEGLSFAEARDKFLSKLKRYIITRAGKSSIKIKAISKDILHT